MNFLNELKTIANKNQMTTEQEISCFTYEETTEIIEEAYHQLNMHLMDKIKSEIKHKAVQNDYQTHKGNNIISYDLPLCSIQSDTGKEFHSTYFWNYFTLDIEEDEVKKFNYQFKQKGASIQGVHFITKNNKVLIDNFQFHISKGSEGLLISPYVVLNKEHNFLNHIKNQKEMLKKEGIQSELLVYCKYLTDEGEITLKEIYDDCNVGMNPKNIKANTEPEFKILMRFYVVL